MRASGGFWHHVLLFFFVFWSEADQKHANAHETSEKIHLNKTSLETSTVVAPSEIQEGKKKSQVRRSFIHHVWENK